MSETIRVSEETHAALAAAKGDDETYDEQLSRLLRERRKELRDGAGLWDGTDAASAARSAREGTNRGVGDR